MDTWAFVAIAVAAVLLIALAIAIAYRSRHRHEQLQERFGPEYDRTVDEFGKRRKAERELADRADERDELEIRPLTPAARQRYASQWQDVQARFVDAPSASVGEADALVTQVMRERGYPVNDFESQSRLVSVDHPAIVENYRAAHTVYMRDRQGNAETEDLREAVVHYRSLFDELLQEEATTAS
jgi:hypothetical protein